MNILEFRYEGMTYSQRLILNICRAFFLQLVFGLVVFYFNLVDETAMQEIGLCFIVAVLLGLIKTRLEDYSS